MHLRALALTFIASACLSGAATVSAADTFSKTRTGVYAAPYSWNGIYGGLSGGYGWGKTRGNFLPAGFGPSLDLEGGLVGGQIGYNYQIGTWVLGFEIDYQWTHIHTSATASSFSEPAAAPGGAVLLSRRASSKTRRITPVGRWAAAWSSA
jgi:outer membrane immunogenic protein